MRTFALHGKTAGSKGLYKAYVVAASDEAAARRLLPDSFKVEHVEMGSPIPGAEASAILYVFESSAPPDKR